MNTVLKSENYFILSSLDKVQLWSKDRLPFEPKNWHREMRNDLKASLKDLKPQMNLVLYAYYASEIEGFCDVENVLFYNVGSGAFSHICREGLIFERRFEKPPDLPDIYFNCQHYHSYHIVEKSDLHNYWFKGDTIATWNDIELFKLNSDSKPHEIWLSMVLGRNKKNEIVKNLPPNTYYGLNISIVSAGKSTNLTSIIKPLLDGIISAFHYHDGSDIIELSERLAIKLSKQPSQVRDLLLDSEKAALGKRKLLIRFREGVQWHPADDMVVHCQLYQTKGKNDSTTINGEIFEVIKPL